MARAKPPVQPVTPMTMGWKAAKEWGLWAVLALALVWVILTDIKPMLVEMNTKIAAHAEQAESLHRSIQQLVSINRVSCVNAARTEAQRADCARQ